MSTPQDWFWGMPPCTRWYFATAMTTTVLITLGVVPAGLIILDFNKVFYKFQIWRLVSDFIFFGPFGIPFIIEMVILCVYMGKLESNYYMGARGTADMITLLGFCGTCLLIIAWSIGTLRMLGPALIFACMYIWSRKDPYRDVVFWGFKFMAWHFPFVVLVLAILGLGNPVMDMLGILVGHIYHFLNDIVPTVYGVFLMKTPDFLYNYFTMGTVRQPNAGWQRGAGYSLQ
eukprot:g20383.t1